MRISIQPYSDQWARDFEREAALLQQRFPSVCAIEHIGSTSVPGMAAKPIIDILVGIPPEDDLNDYAPIILRDKAYLYVPYWESLLPFRRFFIKLDKDWKMRHGWADTIADRRILELAVEVRTCHIHLVRADHPFFGRHLRFRDILRGRSELREQYSALKKELAAREWKNSADYAVAKSAFIESVLSPPIDGRV